MIGKLDKQVDSHRRTVVPSAVRDNPQLLNVAFSN